MKVAVSFIKSRYSEKETIDLINQTSADFLHIDIMDGEFVENKNYDYEDIKMFLKDNHKPLDIHLMCADPLKYIEEYIELKPYNITFHIEAVNNPLRLIELLHDNGIRCGLAINPDTNIKEIKPYLDLIDNVLVMSVYPGKGGQKFIPESTSKINELALLKKNFTIEVDGGVNNEVINNLQNVDIVVSGSYICESEDYQKTMDTLH